MTVLLDGGAAATVPATGPWQWSALTRPRCGACIAFACPFRCVISSVERPRGPMLPGLGNSRTAPQRTRWAVGAWGRRLLFHYRLV